MGILRARDTTYKYFTPSYDVVDGNIDGDFATVNVYERLISSTATVTSLL